MEWRLATRVAFRFAFAYLGLYVLVVMGPPVPGIPGLGELPPFRSLFLWTATHVFGITDRLVLASGSGDKIVDWVTVAWLVPTSVVAVAAWSILDRGRRDYVSLSKWFRLLIRVSLGGTLVVYGISKIIPIQMPYPLLAKLVEPYGNFSPMGVLWASVGSAPAYEMFIGSAEAIGGILLFAPQTTLVGALICLADTVQVFALNMTYDVPVKLASFHLVLMSLFLLAPDASRLANVVLLNRPAGPSIEPPLAAGRRARQFLFWGPIVFGGLLVAMSVTIMMANWNQFGGGAPKPPLYGIWNADEMTTDGQARPPLLTDSGRWRRVIFQFQGFGFVQRMDDGLEEYGTEVDTRAKSLTLTKFGDQNWKARFGYEQPLPEQLILDGEMDGQKLHMQLRLVDRNSFSLVNRGFHWVQERPFNR